MNINTLAEIAALASGTTIVITLQPTGLHLVTRDEDLKSTRFISWLEIESIREPLGLVKHHISAMRAEIESAKDGTIVDVGPDIYMRIRDALIREGSAGHFNERGGDNRIRMTGVTLRSTS